MTARMHSARRGTWKSFSIGLLPLIIGANFGCAAMKNEHAARKVPQLGMIDPHQPRELQMVSLPAYVVEPPDELEIAVKPPLADLSGNLTVRSDGNIDLGFLGDVYVAGLTLEQVERKIGLHLAANPGQKKLAEVSARIVNGSRSKSYYVMGTVTNQGKFPISGNETVLDAILTAGLKSNSLPEKAYLVRPQPAGSPDRILKIDWIGIKDRGDTLTNYQIFPGDRIIVPGGRAPGLLSTLLGG